MWEFLTGFLLKWEQSDVAIFLMFLGIIFMLWFIWGIWLVALPGLIIFIFGLLMLIKTFKPKNKLKKNGG